MMSHSTPSIGADVPALARVYDFVLGGGYHFAADRALAEKLLGVIPGYRDFALENRSFLRRAALHMLDAGIDQFLDLGCGLLSVGPVHEIVHGVDDTCRVVYVDNDPVVTANVELSVGGDPRIGVVNSDLADARRVLDHPTTRRVLDLDRPVGVLAVAVLHCIPDSIDPARILSEYHDRLPAGSLLAASHACGERLGPELTAAAEATLREAGIIVFSRTRAEFATMLGPWNPKPDGVLPTNWWRPESAPNSTAPHGYAVLATSTRAGRGADLVDSSPGP
jgi:hypothetical protein